MTDQIETTSELDLLRDVYVWARVVLSAAPAAEDKPSFKTMAGLAKAIDKVTDQGIKSFDIIDHLQKQKEWSEKTFGPGERSVGVVDHIRKELDEILENPTDLEEWIDVIILGFDGAWRAGYDPWQIMQTMMAKQKKNERREWPDWRTAEPGKAIEHIKPQAHTCTVCGLGSVNPETGEDTCEVCLSKI